MHKAKYFNQEMHKSEKHKTYGKVSFISKKPEIRKLEHILIDSGRSKDPESADHAFLKTSAFLMTQKNLTTL